MFKICHFQFSKSVNRNFGKKIFSIKVKKKTLYRVSYIIFIRLLLIDNVKCKYLRHKSYLYYIYTSILIIISMC